jgi:3-methyladenine DNA glycosylase AlkD
MRALAKEIGRDHQLAQELWKAGYRETRILASMVEEPERVTARQMDQWLRDFSYWEICDQCCMNLFHLLPQAFDKAKAWTRRKAEQQRRAGFALMAILAWKRKDPDEDERFRELLPLLRDGASDDRIPVRKAVSWALRRIGERNLDLEQEVTQLANDLAEHSSKSARWVSRDVLKAFNKKKNQK